MPRTWELWTGLEADAAHAFLRTASAVAAQHLRKGRRSSRVAALTAHGARGGRGLRGASGRRGVRVSFIISPPPGGSWRAARELKLLKQVVRIALRQ